MPGMNGSGPLGQGPLTGGGRGPCGQGLRQGTGFGRGFGPGRAYGRGYGRGHGRGYGYGAWGVSPAVRDRNALAELEERLARLEAENASMRERLSTQE